MTTSSWGYGEPGPEPEEPPRKTRDTGPRFPLVRFRDIKLSTAPRWLIEDLIPRDSLCVVWGKPKCGKTFWVLDMVMHVALGWTYRDKRVEAGIVVYICAEGMIGITSRVEAFRIRHLSNGRGADPPFYLLATRLNLVDEVDQLIAEIRQQIGDDRPVIIVIDTLNRTIKGSESKDADMTAYVQAADTVRFAFEGSTVIPIHHCGHDDTRLRGFTGLSGAVDMQLAVRRNENGAIVAEVEAMRDGEQGGQMQGNLAVVDIGIDDNGKQLTSCVIEHDLEAPAVPATATQKKLSSSAARALALLHDAINNGGGTIPPASNHIPPGTSCVEEKVWRQYCHKGGLSTGETRQSRNKAFNNARATLLDHGRIGCWDDLVWPIAS